MPVFFAFGGVGLFVLLILLVFAILIGLLLYLTGGTLWERKTNPSSEPPPAQPPASPQREAERVFDGTDNDGTRRSLL